MLSIHFLLIQLSTFFLGRATETKSINKLLLISFDGFRHDYLDKAILSGVKVSGFQRILSTGFRALRVENEFITRTAPNHYSMVTGQHEETHGLVDNVFFDPQLNQTFVFGDESQMSQSVWFDNGAEPIWVTNQLHGHRSGVTSWPGSLAAVKGLLPSVHHPRYDRNYSLRSSINDVLNWLQEDINLSLLYYSEPDSTGHKTGPSSLEVMNVIGNLSDDLDYLLDRIEKHSSLQKSLNIILTSDHGMTNVDPRRIIVLEDFLSDSMYDSASSDVRAVWDLWPKAEFTPNDLVERLKKKHQKLSVYHKKELPARLFYSHSHRIAPVILIAELGWMIAKSKGDAASFKRQGQHGYDPASPDMSPFFLAMGPGFRSFPPNHTIPSIKMVDIYPMMCHLLGLNKPGPHNGSLSRVAHLLRSADSGLKSWFHSYWDTFTAFMVFAIVGIISLTFMIAACLVHCHPWKGSTHRMRRARQRKGIQQRHDILLRRLGSTKGHPEGNLLNGTSSITPGHATPEDVQRLLLTSTAEDEVEHFRRSSRFQIDDSTLLQMIHDPRSRFP